VIDKVALRVSGYTPYSPEFDEFYRDSRNDPKGPFRPSPHYLAAADLRAYGFPVLLHTHNLHDKFASHKLEFLETGTLGYTQMRREIHRIFDTDAGSLAIMRLDVAVDVVGVSVEWFKQQAFVRYKRWTCDIGKIPADAENSSMGKTGVETFYYGRRPNLIRIYNKVQERRQEYIRLRKRAWALAKKQAMGGPVGFVFPNFETVYGYPERGFILTRVERQMAGGRVPQAVGTFGRLRAAVDFNPFEKLAFLEGGRPQPNPDDYEFGTYAIGMFIRRLIQDEGIHRAKQFLNRASIRHACRLLRTYRDFLPSDSGHVTQKDLVEKYRRSVAAQLAA
jgi:hypothetical protein